MRPLGASNSTQREFQNGIGEEARLVSSLTGPGRNSADVCSGVCAQLLSHV